MSSMSVHYLINKFLNQEKPISLRHKSDPPEPNYKASAPSYKSASREFLDYSPDLRHRHTSPVSPEENPMPDLPRPEIPGVPPVSDLVPELTLVSFFGPEMKHLRMSAPNLQAALQLRAEQERTKQEQIRLDIATKNLQIIELATKNDVPPHLIPAMCIGNAPKTIPGPNINVSTPGHTPGHRHRLHLGGESVPSTNSSLHGLPFLSHQNIARNYEHPDNASLVPPASFRIGTGSSRYQAPNQNLRRPRSPAKIGAAAVASLASPVTPYVPTQRTLPLHQRHFSMPLEALPSSRNVERKQKGQAQFGVFPGSMSSPGEEATGKVSSMQVKPLPAQPLYKQTKSSQVPSQESMTSFQHVILFHHWKPENAPDKPEDRRDNIQPMATRLSMHKRHKSNDMSVDLLNDPAVAEFRNLPQPKIEDNEEDVSMNTSEIAGPEQLEYTEARRFSRSSNKGSVDILSTQ